MRCSDLFKLGNIKAIGSFFKTGEVYHFYQFVLNKQLFIMSLTRTSGIVHKFCLVYFKTDKTTSQTDKKVKGPAQRTKAVLRMAVRLLKQWALLWVVSKLALYFFFNIQ